MREGSCHRARGRFMDCTEVQVLWCSVGHPDEPLPGGQGYCFRAVIRTELGEDRADVEFHGPLGDEEPLGDLAVVETLGDQPQYLQFPGRKQLRLRLFAAHML